MKKSICILFILCFLLMLASCQTPMTSQTSTSGSATTEQTTSGAETTNSASSSTEATTTSAAGTTPETTGPTSESETTGTTAETTAETTGPTTEATTPSTTTAETGPVNTAVIYSSYALLKAYDPTTNWAKFDYFDMLKGDDAVQWLVEHEGYTLEDAEEEVSNYADSEFIMKNVNPQLRTFDLTELPLKLMYEPDGTPIMDATPIDADIDDWNALFSVHPEYLLNSFFFYVHTSDGVVQSIDQVYWP